MELWSRGYDHAVMVMELMIHAQLWLFSYDGHELVMIYWQWWP